MALTPGNLVFHGPFTFELIQDADVATVVTAGDFVVGLRYVIKVPGTTDFTLIGAGDSLAGTQFKATGVGTGTGTAYLVTKLTRTALKGDSLVFGIETKKGNASFEDGTEDDWEEGRKLTCEINISEINTTDMANIEAATNMIITMLNGKVATVATTMRWFADVDGGKLKITGWKAVAIGSAMSDLVVVT